MCVRLSSVCLSVCLSVVCNVACVLWLNLNGASYLTLSYYWSHFHSCHHCRYHLYHLPNETNYQYNLRHCHNLVLYVKTDDENIVNRPLCINVYYAGSIYIVISCFLADRTNGRAIGTVLRLSSSSSSSVCNVMYCG